MSSATTSYYKFYDKGNWDNTKDFLMNAYKELGKMLSSRNNARYHKPREIARLTRETNGAIQVRFIPKYTPELSPIETQWIPVKDCTLGLVFKDMDEAKEVVMNGIPSGVIPIVMVHDYLIPE